MQMRPKCTGRARKLGRNATPSAPRFGANFQKTMPKLGLHCSISLNPKCYPIRPALRSLQFSASSVQNRPGTSLNEPCTDSPASAGIEFCQLVLHKLAHCDMPNTQMPQLLKLVSSPSAGESNGLTFCTTLCHVFGLLLPVQGSVYRNNTSMLQGHYVHAADGITHAGITYKLHSAR